MECLWNLRKGYFYVHFSPWHRFISLGHLTAAPEVFMLARRHARSIDAIEKQTRNNSESWQSQAGCFHSSKETRPKLWSAGMKIIRWDHVTRQGARNGGKRCILSLYWMQAALLYTERCCLTLPNFGCWRYSFVLWTHSKLKQYCECHDDFNLAIQTKV